MTATFTTADIEGLADLLAIANEEMSVHELHPNVAARYFGLAVTLTTGNLPRDPQRIAEAIAFDFHDTGHLGQVASWQFARALDIADDVLDQF